MHTSRAHDRVTTPVAEAHVRLEGRSEGYYRKKQGKWLESDLGGDDAAKQVNRVPVYYAASQHAIRV